MKKILLKDGDRITFKPWDEWTEDYGIGRDGFYRDYDHHPVVYTVENVSYDHETNPEWDYDEFHDLSFGTQEGGYIFIADHIQTINGRPVGYVPETLPEELFAI